MVVGNVMNTSSTLAMSTSLSSQDFGTAMRVASQSQATPSQLQPEQPQLRRLKHFHPRDIPMDDHPGQHVNQSHHHQAQVGVELKWWARGEWANGRDSDDSSSNKPSDKSDCSMESLIDRVANINLNVNLNDYFERRDAPSFPSQGQGVKKHHTKQQIKKDTTQSVKITDFFTKKKPSK